MRAKDIMTKDVKMIRSESTLRRAAQLMKKHKIGILPIYDGGNIIGVITDRDIVLRSTSKGENPNKIKVKDIMTPRFVSCYEDQSLDKVAEQMENARLKRIPIVDYDNNLSGIISVGDFAIRYSDKIAAKVFAKVSEQGG